MQEKAINKLKQVSRTILTNIDYLPIWTSRHVVHHLCQVLFKSIQGCRVEKTKFDWMEWQSNTSYPLSFEMGDSIPEYDWLQIKILAYHNVNGHQTWKSNPLERTKHAFHLHITGNYSPERVPLQLGFCRFLGTWRILARKKCARISKVVCHWRSLTFFRRWFYNIREMPNRKIDWTIIMGRRRPLHRAKWGALTMTSSTLTP